MHVQQQQQQEDAGADADAFFTFAIFFWFAPFLSILTWVRAYAFVQSPAACNGHNTIMTSRQIFPCFVINFMHTSQLPMHGPLWSTLLSVGAATCLLLFSIAH